MKVRKSDVVGHLHNYTSIRENGGGANERSKVIRNNKIVNSWFYSHDNHSICLNYSFSCNYKQIIKTIHLL